MPSLTIKDIPRSLLNRLRKLAKRADQSLSKVVVRLLEEALPKDPKPDRPLSPQEAARYCYWLSIKPKWISDESYPW